MAYSATATSPRATKLESDVKLTLFGMRVAAEDGSGLMERSADKRVWARMDERGDAASPRCVLRFCDRLAVHGSRLYCLITGELRDPEESHP